MNGLELLVLVKAIVIFSLTIYLRKELYRHGFKMWVFAQSPSFVILIIFFIIWLESPSAFTESLFWLIATLAITIAFISTFIGVVKGRR